MVRHLPAGSDPELAALHPDGRRLFVANEDDNMVTVVDVERGVVLREISVGVEPEGLGISPDGRWVVNTSETTNMAHVIEADSGEVVANVLVGARPRAVVWEPDSKRFWVSAEIGGTLTLIEAGSWRVAGTVTFAVPGVPPEAIQPVGMALSRDGRRLFVALGPANRVAVVDTRSLRRGALSPGRAAGVEPGALAGRVAALHDQRRQQRPLRDRHRGRCAWCGRCRWGRRPGAWWWCRDRRRRSTAAGALEVERLSFSYGERPALREVGFRIVPGEFAVLLGPNGAGKTTLFALVTRLFDAPGEAAIRVFGADLRRDPRRALAALGVVFQQPTLDPDLTVRAEPALPRGAARAAARGGARRGAARELERVGLADRAAEQGAQPVRRAAAPRRDRARPPAPARGSCCSTSRRSGSTRRAAPSCSTMCAACAASDGLAVLWATHLIDEVGEEARVVVLRDGEVRADGAVPEVLAQAGGAATMGEAFARSTAAPDARAPPERSAARTERAA